MDCTTGAIARVESLFLGTARNERAFPPAEASNSDPHPRSSFRSVSVVAATAPSANESHPAGLRGAAGAVYGWAVKLGRHLTQSGFSPRINSAAESGLPKPFGVRVLLARALQL